jgi:hypothetical protein
LQYVGGQKQTGYDVPNNYREGSLHVATSALVSALLVWVPGPATADEWTKIETWYGLYGDEEEPVAMTSHDKGRNWYGQYCDSLGCRFFHYIRKCNWWTCRAESVDGDILHREVCHSDSPFSAMQCD